MSHESFLSDLEVMFPRSLVATVGSTTVVAAREPGIAVLTVKREVCATDTCDGGGLTMLSCGLTYEGTDTSSVLVFHDYGRAGVRVVGAGQWTLGRAQDAKRVWVINVVYLPGVRPQVRDEYAAAQKELQRQAFAEVGVHI